jgi:non-heme chloroperoxidase
MQTIATKDGIYEKLSHGMCTTHADVINADLLAFIRS